MAKRRRRRSRSTVKSSSSNTQIRRDAPVIANGVQPLLDFVPSPRSGRFLLEVEDRRKYHPLGVFRPASSLRRANHRLVVSSTKVERPSGVRRRRAVLFRPPSAIAFRAPEHVLVCVRRHRRREVLFAKRRAGRMKMRAPRRSWYSQISCRR